MNGILGSYNLIDSLAQSVAQCTTDRYASATLNLCNRSETETCYVDIAVTTIQNAFNTNSRYLEFNSPIGPNSTLQRNGIIISAGEFLTVVYRGRDPRCLSANVWAVQTGNDLTVPAIVLVEDPAPVIVTTSLPNAEEGSTYSQQIVATDNREIVDYSITAGALPTGLSLNNTTGIISGTPGGIDQAYTFTVRVTDSTDGVTQRELIITKVPDATGPVFDSEQLLIDPPVFEEGTFGTYTITATDPSTPITYSISSGSLPSGLSLSSGGILSGTPGPGTVNDYSVTVRATDSAGNTTDQVVNFSIIVAYEIVNFTGVSGNLTVTGNNTDSVDIVKSGGSNSWDNQAFTAQIYYAPVTLEFSSPADSGDNGASYKMIGWNVDPQTDANYTSIDHASYPYQQNQYVVADNNNFSNLSAWNTNQKIYLVYTDTGLIQHWNGNVKLYEAAYNPGLVAVDSSFYSPNTTFGRLDDIRISKAMWNGSRLVSSSIPVGSGLSSDDPVVNSYRFSGTAGETYWIQPPGAATPFEAEYSGDNYRNTNTGYFNWWKNAYRTAPTVNFYNQGYQWNSMMIEQEGTSVFETIGFTSRQTFNFRTSTDTGTWGTRRGFRVFFGQAGGHGIYNTSQNPCSWSNSNGSIGAGYDGSTCGSFPNDLVMGTGSSSSTYNNRSGVWNFWFAFS